MFKSLIFIDNILFYFLNLNILIIGHRIFFFTHLTRFYSTKMTQNPWMKTFRRHCTEKKSASWTSTETERGRITCPLFETLIKMPFYPLQKNLFLKTVSLQNDSCPCRAVPDFLPCLLHLWDSQNMLTVIYEIEKEKRNILKHNVETKNFSCQEEDE